MKPINDYTPAAIVTGLYQVDGPCLEPLTEEYPLTPEMVSEFPIVIDLEFDPAYDFDSIIVDLIYDTMDPIPLPDLIRGSNIPCCVPYWFHWFTIPDVVLHGKNGRVADPRTPGIHTIQIRTARKTGVTGNVRNFSPANGGWMSGVTTFVIAEEDFEDPGDTDDDDE
ncbi:MAG: hypothetical protein A4E34_02190 [Methanoregula sp. PtaU1.Bin006]|uniref:hypothetical protein n=1 Tax=Methanoregula sp. PtaU1.Bin006 TaxID=1811681 RepID=UPI0009CA7804|nr:hypothetical protein [Methanoregula sp. PtaU1.Bin006]OPY32813.1 MAG: hypothetical protein A4E34_02190 [Methanoregula sp. PtaU1.Bin006]